MDNESHEFRARPSAEAELRRYVRVGIASSNSLYPCSEENLPSSVGTITPIERSTTCGDAGKPNRTKDDQMRIDVGVCGPPSVSGFQTGFPKPHPSDIERGRDILTSWIRTGSESSTSYDLSPPLRSAVGISRPFGLDPLQRFSRVCIAHVQFTVRERRDEISPILKDDLMASGLSLPR